MPRSLSRSLLSLVLVLAGSSLLATARADTAVNLATHLTGAPLNGIKPVGDTHYYSKDGHSLYGISVENVALPDNTTLNVNLNGTAFTSIVLQAGQAIWRLSTGLGDTIPTMQAGDVISVTDSSNSVILSGTLHVPVPIQSLSASLTGPPINHIATSGSAHYTAQGTHLTFAIKVKVNLIDGTQLTVNDNGIPFATLTLAGGLAALKLDTNNGDTIPAMSAGDVIDVTLANGDSALSGILLKPVRNIVSQHARLSGHAINGVTPYGYTNSQTGTGFAALGMGVLNLNLPDGTVVNFNLNGTTVASGILRLGRVFMRLDTEDGDTVPATHVGDVVTVTDTSGNILLHGTLIS
ncbi:MAG TPA: hypothetical protein VKU00_24230 [Chthonomonadaceae bacterium]|nr:hypothetical protein [Chthonomonadaceae bacterium]